MNCLFLLVLLCCCGGHGQRCDGAGCGRSCNCDRDCRDNRRGGACSCGCGHVHEEIRPFPREGACPCQDARTEPVRTENRQRPEPMPRPFPPFADGPSCGCDD